MCGGAISASAQAHLAEREEARLQAGAARHALPRLEGEIAAKRKKRRTWSGACSPRSRRSRATSESEVLLCSRVEETPSKVKCNSWCS